MRQTESRVPATARRREERLRIFPALVGSDQIGESIHASIPIMLRMLTFSANCLHTILTMIL